MGRRAKSGTLTTSRSQIWDFRKKTLPLHSHITPWWWNGRHDTIFASTMKSQYTKEDVINAVAENKSIAGVLRQLNLRPIGGNYKTIHRLIKEYGLDTSHFTGQGWNVGLGFKPKQSIKDEEIYVENSDYRCSWRLRERYKKTTGINYCEVCGLTEWQGKPIPLEIHHLNG